jgi:lantibiotic modifying enzyme
VPLAPYAKIEAIITFVGMHTLMQAHTGHPAVEQYRAFIGRMLNGGLFRFFQEYAVTHESAFLEAAREAIAFERSVFSPEERNWPDFRGSTGTVICCQFQKDSPQRRR